MLTVCELKNILSNALEELEDYSNHSEVLLTNKISSLKSNFILKTHNKYLDLTNFDVKEVDNYDEDDYNDIEDYNEINYDDFNYNDEDDEDDYYE